MIENFEKTSEYVRELVKSDKVLKDLQNYAIEKKVPIITSEVLDFMIYMLKFTKAKNVLEIGTAIGYSGIFLAKNCENLTTIEIDENRYIEAKENFKKYGVNNVKQILGDANEEILKLDDKFDFVFIDAAKSNYMNFFNLTYPLLNQGGLIFIDNILFKGYVSTTGYPKRYKTIVKNLRNFIDYLNENYDFSLLPFGDGVALIKKI